MIDAKCADDVPGFAGRDFASLDKRFGRTEKKK